MARNYLNNRDMLLEIHKSKMSYCYCDDDQYFFYDLILDNVEEITNDKIALGRWPDRGEAFQLILQVLFYSPSFGRMESMDMGHHMAT